MSSPPNDFTDVDNPEQELELYSSWVIANLRAASCTIAIDDLHHTESDDRIAELLVRVIDACRDNIQWILSSRSNALIPRTQWQAYGIADEPIMADDLRMDHDEACKLAAALRSPVSPSELARWVLETNGFPVPLAYAIRASARRRNLDGITDGMRSLTFRFLAEQLWHSLNVADRNFLELAALIPPSHIRDYESDSTSNASPRIVSLCDDIAFLTLSTTGLFSMHDLFRDFVRLQTSLRGASAYRDLIQRAQQLLFKSGRFIDALELLLEVGDIDSITDAVERCPLPLTDLELTPRLIALTGSLPLENLQIKALALHTEYWTHCGSPAKVLRYAEEILKRSNAGSDHLLCAVRAISRFTHFQSTESQRAWLKRMPGIIERLNQPDHMQAIAYQASYCSRYPELHGDARRLLESVMCDIHDLDPRSRLDTQLTAVTAFLGLDEIGTATEISRDAVNLAKELGDPVPIAKTLNALGMILYAEGDPEYTLVSETSRPIIAKSGAWRFSQTSHWFPAEYYARLGDSERALQASALHDEVILTDGAQARILNYVRRLTMIVCNLIDGKYHAVINDIARIGFPDSVDGPYHIAIAAAFAYGFLGRADEAVANLTRAKALREKTVSLWQQRGLFGISSGELVALCLVGRWSQALRLVKSSERVPEGSKTLDRALALLANGPPFAGVKEALAPCQGQPYVGLIALLAMRTIDQSTDKEASPNLTVAELDVLRLLRLGRTNKDIADARNRSTETVKRQVASIYRKLGVENRTSAVAIALERGLF